MDSDAVHSVVEISPITTTPEVEKNTLFSGVRGFCDNPSSLATNTELDEGENKCQLRYRTKDGAVVTMILVNPGQEDRQIMVQHGAFASFFDKNGASYLKINKLQIDGPAGSVDLAVEAESGILVVPAEDKYWSGISQITESTPLLERLSADDCAATIEPTARGVIFMSPVLGREELVVFEHELDHLRRRQQEARLGILPFSKKLRESAGGEFVAILGKEESLASAGGEYYGSRMLDRVYGESDVNREIAKKVDEVGRNNYVEAFSKSHPGSDTTAFRNYERRPEIRVEL